MLSIWKKNERNNNINSLLIQTQTLETKVIEMCLRIFISFLKSYDAVRIQISKQRLFLMHKLWLIIYES